MLTSVTDSTSKTDIPLPQQQPHSKATIPAVHVQPRLVTDLNLGPVYVRMPEIVPELEAGRRINADLRRKFVREVVDEVRKISSHCGKKDFETIAERITRKYPNTFQDRIGDIRIGSGHDSLLKQLVARNENVNRSSQPTRKATACTADDEPKGTETPSKKKCVSERDTYGCVNWSPTLSHDDFEEQEKVRTELIQMHKNVDRDMGKAIEKMAISYGLLRNMINNGEAVEQLIAKWPFLTEPCILLKHCEKLIGLNVIENIERAYLQKGPVLLKFFKSKQNLQQFLVELEAEKTNDNLEAILQGIILSIQRCLGEEMTSLMFSVDVSKRPLYRFG